MRVVASIIQNLEETRRRSIKIWESIPETYWHWKTDSTSMSLIETVRHILDGDEWYKQHIQDRDTVNLNYEKIFGERTYLSIQNELEINRKSRSDFITYLQSFSDSDLETILIMRRNGTKSLSLFLTEIAYHEAFHAGQIQLCLRILHVPRENIWD